MAAKRKPTITHYLMKLMLFFPSLLCMVWTIASEAELAGKSLGRILVFSFILALLLFSSWLCLLVMLFTYLVQIHVSYMLSLSMILLINLLLTAIIYFCLDKIKNNLYFPETIKQIKKIADHC